MNKSDITTLIEDYLTKEQLVQALYNYFDLGTLEEFLDFLITEEMIPEEVLT